MNTLQSWRGSSSTAHPDAASRGWIHSVGHWDTADASHAALFSEEEGAYSGKDVRIEAGADGRLARESLIARDAAQVAPSL